MGYGSAPPGDGPSDKIARRLRHLFQSRESVFRRAVSMLRIEEHARNLEVENQELRDALVSRDSGRPLRHP